MEVRGHGESDVPGQPFDMDDLSDDVIEMIRAVGGGKAIVGGCSMGGQIAQGVGVKAPENLHGIFISNTGYLRNDKIREVMEARAAAAEKGMSGPVWTTLNRWFNEDYKKAHPEHVQQAYDWLINADPIVHAWSWRAIKGLPYAERLKSLKVPALAIAGEHDQSSAPDGSRGDVEGDPELHVPHVQGRRPPLARRSAARVRRLPAKSSPTRSRADRRVGRVKRSTATRDPTSSAEPWSVGSRA